MTPQEMAATHAAAFTQARPWSAAEFESLLDSPHVFVSGDRRCFALVRVIAGEAELLTIATRPDQQRQGLAREAMRAWQNEAAARGAGTAFLEVAADNEAALKLYESCKFSQAGRRHRYYPRDGSEAVDALLMKRGLP